MAFLFINEFLSLGEVFLDGTQYAGYTELIAETSGSNIFRLITAALPLLLALWRKEEVIRLNDKLLNICINMSIYYFCFMLLSTVIGGIFIGRVAAYFDIYNLLLYPLILTNCLISRIE